MYKKIAYGVFGLLLLATPLVSSAQVSASVQAQIDALLKQITQLQAQIATLRGQSTPPATGTSACLDLNNSLVIGSTDATTNGEVSKLQRFLAAYIWDRFHDADGDSGISQPVTGYYGRVTAQNVMDWQKEHGMDFVTLTSGVGPMTRAKMACSSKNVVTNTCVNGPVQTTEGLREGIPVITSISPVSGPKGTKITLTGCNLSGFEGDHNVDLESGSSSKVRIVGAGTYQLGRGERGTFIEFTMKEPCQNGETVYGAYSGIPSTCNFIELVSGKYKVSTTPWGEKSNDAYFTLTQ